MAQNSNANSLEYFKLRFMMWRDAIPLYGGGTKLLSYFVETCDGFLMNLATDDDLVSKSLFAFIKSKIRGEALDLIVSKKPATWNECKALLISRFSDSRPEELLLSKLNNSRSEELLFNKLNTCYRQSNQDYEKYADEIERRLNKIKKHLQNNCDDDNMISEKIVFYKSIAKNVFINGVGEPYHSHLMNFDMIDIEDCLVKCRKYDDNEQQAAFFNFMRQRGTATEGTSEKNLRMHGLNLSQQQQYEQMNLHQ